MSKSAHPIHATNAAMLLGFRGIAAIWIFIGHLMISPVYDLGFIDNQSDQGLGWLHHIIFFRFLAVDIFLMMSGCLLYIGYHRYFEQPTKSKDIDLFFLHRIARLYPLYAISIGIIALYHWLDIPHPIYSGRSDALFEQWPLTLGLNALFMNAWGIVPAASWNEPSWTLSIIAFLYVLFPNLVVLVKHVPRSTMGGLICIFGLIGLYYVSRETILPQWLGQSISHSDGTGAIMRGIFFFLIGCIAGRIYAYNDVKQHPWHLIMPTLYIAFIVFMLLWREGYLFDMVVFHLLYPFFMLGLLATRDTFTRALFTNRLVLKLGVISYGIYLLHYPVCLLVEYLAGDWLQTVATGNGFIDSWIYGSVILITCILAELSYRYIENPCNRWVKQRFLLKRPPE